MMRRFAALPVAGAGFRVVANGLRGANRLSLSAALLFAFALVQLFPLEAVAICDVIPGVQSEFRGALGSLNRPFAIPGDEGERIAITLDPSGCDIGSPGFLDLPGGTDPEDDYFVTVLFTPPQGGTRNAVVLTTESNEATCLAAVADPPGGVSATCRAVEPDTQGLEITDPSTLVFRFPDTDAELAPDHDDHTFSGPATIAVSRVFEGDGETPASLPFDLASTRCADSSGLIACVDELYARDGTCETEPDHIDSIFGHFTVLPPANDYQALCTTTDPGAPCTGLADELRFTIDAAGNALVPMDYRGVLVQSDQIPIPRLILGDTEIEAFSGTAAAVALPSGAFLASYSPGGHRLPPVFTPLSNPEAEGQLSLFGSVDAPVGVIRVTRQGCVGGAKEGDPCATDAQCGSGATCEQLFDFSDRLLDGVGPVLIAQTEFDLQTQNPVPLDGLIESESMFAFVANEAIEGVELNDDTDQTDPVLRIRDRLTGTILPIGTSGADGRAATRVKDGRFRFPAVAAEGDIVAFLELEPLEGYRDTNANGSVFDPILRVYRVLEDCGGGSPCAEEITASLPIPLAVDAAPLVEGRSVAISSGLVYFRIPEWRQARQVTERVSVASDGDQGNEDSVYWWTGLPSLSADGLIVAFDSLATNLVPGDSNGEIYLEYGVDVFVRDRATGATERVSVASDGGQGNYQSRNPSLSADGRIVAFNSGANNLIPNDTNSRGDIFVHDRMTRETKRVSLACDGAQGNGSSFRPSLSSDGQVVAFGSWANNLVLSDMQLCETDSGLAYNCPDVFLHDRATEATELVSVASDGTQGNGRSGLWGSLQHTFSLSSEGRVVAFTSEASNLVPGDTNLNDDVFVGDRATGKTERASVASDGAQGNSFSLRPSLSGDGRVVAFYSDASNLVPGDTNGWEDVFVHDRATGETERLSVAFDGSQGNHRSGSPSLSADGRVVAFHSNANFVPGDTNYTTDVFVHDRATGTTERVSVASDGAQGNRFSGGPSLSGDGRVVAFTSNASNLVPGDTNSVLDVFAHGPDETDLTSDLSGDGDLRDTLLATLDVVTGGVTLLCPAVRVAVKDGSAAFLRPMASGPCAAGAGLGGDDGGSEDLVVHLFVPGQGVQSLGRPATAVALSPDLVGALVGGNSGGTEAQAYDRVAQGWRTTGEAADSIAVVSTTLAFTSPEAEVGADWNGDGDLLDRVVRIFRREGGALLALSGLPAPAVEEFVLGERLVAFRTREMSQREDLNRDGDFRDDVLQVFDLASRRLFNTEQAVTPCPLEACDPRYPYRVDGDTVTFITSEAAQGGQDLNGDGDAVDLVKQVFNAREAALLAPLSGEAAEFVDAIAATSAGICTTTGSACASDVDCGEGSCYLPPGGCIANLETSCTCTDSGCFGCGDDEFCVPFVGGDGAGSCHVNEGPCVSQSDCASPAVCTDAEADVQRLFAPVADMGTGGGETVFSSGTCVEDHGTLCNEADDCQPGDVCGSSGTCQRRFGSCGTDADCSPGLSCAPNLVTVNAADSDADGVADPFDNCPRTPNTDQADNDGDEVGDLCDLCDLTDPDSDLDGRPDCADNCPHVHNPGQEDPGGIGYASVPDGIGEVCQCGDVSGDGFVTTADTLMIRRSLLDPPTATLVSPELCDVDGDGTCTMGDVERIRGALLVPPTAEIQQSCSPAVATRTRSGAACGLGYEPGALLPLLFLLARRRQARRGLAL